MIKYLEKLTQIPGISGYEHFVREYIEEEINKIGGYEIVKDNLGSIFAVKKSSNTNAKKVMIAGHMDEIGFIVSNIRNNGTLELENVGGINTVNYQGLTLNVYYNGLNYAKGVVISIPPHLKHLSSGDNSLILDIGAKSKEEVINLGINIGSMVTSENVFSKTFNNEAVIARAIDNRFGCALALKTIKDFKNINLDFDLIIGATVQEEVGLRGAETSAQLFNPDIFIALDASPVIDALDDQFNYKLGDGFLMRMYDPRNILVKDFRKYFIEIANENNIKFQQFVSFGGTDAAKVIDLEEGILATTIGIPARYIHAPAAIANLEDLDAAKNMLYALLKDLNDEKIKILTKEMV